jgi:soluble lytic murein transglycosylase-like protein
VEISNVQPVPDTRAETTRPNGDEADAARAAEACREFESLLIYNMLSSMRRAFSSEDRGDGLGGDLFGSMMDEQLSMAMAEAGGLGLADMLAQGLGLEELAAKVPCSVQKVVRAVAPALRKAARSVEAAESAVAGRVRDFDSTIRAAARTFGLSPDLIRSVIIQESGGNPGAVSPKGAKGLMQLMDSTAVELGVTDPFDPVQNIFGGTRLLSELLDRFKGNLRLALAAYNAGAGAVKRYGGVPPYRETRDYVERITGRLDALGVDPDDVHWNPKPAGDKR